MNENLQKMSSFSHLRIGVVQPILLKNIDFKNFVPFLAKKVVNS
jgi:hypothetical protein